MTDPVLFALAVLTLLATPGPTNTLLAASGAAAGLRRSLILVPAELSAYLISITTLMAVASPLVADRPLVMTGLKLTASVWLIGCAVRMWTQGGTVKAQVPISSRRVFTTTLLNPKGLIFALAIMPPGGPVGAAPWLAGFAVMVVMVALCWITAGTALARLAGSLATPRRICGLASAALACFAVLLAGSALAALTP